jgi:hypothetical protein
MKIHRRNGVLWQQTVFGKIFSAHGRLDHFDVLIAERFFPNRHQSPG